MTFTHFERISILKNIKSASDTNFLQNVITYIVCKVKQRFAITRKQNAVTYLSFLQYKQFIKLGQANAL